MNLGKVMEEKRFSRRFWHLSLHSSRQMIREKSFPSLSFAFALFLAKKRERGEHGSSFVIPQQGMKYHYILACCVIGRI